MKLKHPISNIEIIEDITKTSKVRNSSFLLSKLLFILFIVFLSLNYSRELIFDWIWSYNETLFQYLLLSTVGGGYWKLILEQNVGGTSYQSLIKLFNKPPFVLTQINKFGTETVR